MVLTLNNVQYAYASGSSFTLGPLSLELHSTGVTALIGSNGSGKTTLIRVLLNQLVNYTGTYMVDGQKVKDLTGSFLHAHGIGYAPEHPVLEERLTGIEILYLLKEIHKIGDSDFAATIGEWRTLFQLDEWFETTPCRECSQGMRKKISLLIALAGNPGFLIIDEPTNGLDPISVFGLKKILSERKSRGLGTLVSSHMLDFVERIADEVIIMKKGGRAFAGTTEALFAAYPGKRLDEIYYHMFMRELPGLSHE